MMQLAVKILHHIFVCATREKICSEEMGRNLIQWTNNGLTSKPKITFLSCGIEDVCEYVRHSPL